MALPEKKDHGQRRRFVAKDALSFNTMLTRVNLSRGRTTSSRLGRLGPAPKKAHGQRRRFVTKEASSWKTWLTRVLRCRRRTTLSCLCLPSKVPPKRSPKASKMPPKRSLKAKHALMRALKQAVKYAPDRLVKCLKVGLWNC